MNPNITKYVCDLSPGPNSSHSLPDRLPRPSLTAENGSLVPLGENVTLRCRGSWEADLYHLEKEKGSKKSKIMDVRAAGIELEFPISYVTAKDAGTYHCWYRHSFIWSEGSQANFFIPAVNSTHDGTYQCHSFQSYYPFEWSTPSDPLVLKVTDAPVQDYTVGNLVCLILAGLILIILGFLLIENWYSLRRYEKQSKEPLPELSRQTRPQGRDE
uniref:Immunoglobulin-like beta-sandwich domain-containing protein n=1 Tax=Monodelphis domestica TaxID=13616 RepID=F7CXW3_MONDO